MEIMPDDRSDRTVPAGERPAPAGPVLPVSHSGGHRETPYAATVAATIVENMTITTHCSGPAGPQRPQVWIETCGNGHSELPAGHIVIGVAEWFRDPHISPEFRQLTARDPRVVEHVRRTPGVLDFTADVFRLLRTPVGLGLGTVKVVIWCVGGRHRAPSVGLVLAELCRESGWSVTLSHRDLDKPVLDRRGR